jgi:hypothetical protein
LRIAEFSVPNNQSIKLLKQKNFPTDRNNATDESAFICCVVSIRWALLTCLVTACRVWFLWRDTMTLEKRFEKALGSSDRVEALRSLVGELSAEGCDKTAILEIFEEQRQRLRSANRESEEDAVMDVMDFLVGWCSPHMKLLSLAKKQRRQRVG